MVREEDTQAYLEQLGRNSGMVLGLDSIRELMAELGNVQDKLQFIHVAGTNGKGSVCAFLSSVLTEAGIRVGAYTSPAVFGRLEQYRVNGKNITEQEFAEVISEVRRACEKMTAKGKRQPTVFEVETAAAFLYFARRQCRIIVLETGLGGSMDATNIIKNPLLSIITSISLDHTKVLGNSLLEIAQAKAGIIKENGRVLAVKPVQEQVRLALEETCEKKHAVLTYSDEERAEHIAYESGGEKLCFTYQNLGKVELSMAGIYQVQNAVCAIEAAKILRETGICVSDDNIRTGLLKARWDGRFSILCSNPLLALDGAHNSDAAQKLRETLKRGFTNYKLIYIIGVLADKEHEEMLKTMLPLAWKVFTVTPDSPRALDGKALAEEAGKYHEHVEYCSSIKKAAGDALKCAGREKTMVLAFGSLSYMKELREILKEKLDDDR